MGRVHAWRSSKGERTHPTMWSLGTELRGPGWAASIQSFIVVWVIKRIWAADSFFSQYLQEPRIHHFKLSWFFISFSEWCWEDRCLCFHSKVEENEARDARWWPSTPQGESSTSKPASHPSSNESWLLSEACSPGHALGTLMLKTPLWYTPPTPFRPPSSFMFLPARWLLFAPTGLCWAPPLVSMHTPIFHYCFLSPSPDLHAPRGPTPRQTHCHMITA